MPVTEKRIRVNAKQTAKNLWYFDVTVEVSGIDLSADDIDILAITLAKEKEYRNDKRKLVSDDVS